MSAIGPKRIWAITPHMSAFGGKAAIGQSGILRISHAACGERYRPDVRRAVPKRRGASASKAFQRWRGLPPVPVSGLRFLSGTWNAGCYRRIRLVPSALVPQKRMLAAHDPGLLTFPLYVGSPFFVHARSSKFRLPLFLVCLQFRNWALALAV